MQSMSDSKFKCSYTDKVHELENPKVLPCGDTICDKCVNEYFLSLTECELCGETHLYTEIFPNKLVNRLIEERKKEISNEKLALQALRDLAVEFKNKVNLKNELLNKVTEFYRDDISIKVESIKYDLHKLETNIFDEINEIEESYKKVLVELNFDKIMRDYETIKSSKTEQPETAEHKEAAKIFLQKLEQTKNKLNSIYKTVKFIPNEEILPLNYTFVGSIRFTNKFVLNLTKLTELKRKEFFTTASNYSNVYLNVVGLALDLNSNIIVSERNENRLIKLDKNCSYLNGTNSLNELSNSCGICINSLNQIYVTDAKYNTILKFNSEFSLLNQIGPSLGSKFGKLNYPWGIASNTEINANNNNSSDDYIYVCDYKNSRCIKFNNNLCPVDQYKLTKEQKPRRVQIKFNTVYILHKSENSIYISVFDLTSCELLRSIKQAETNIKSFFIDDLLNIFTIGQLNNNEPNQYLNCYNKSNQLLFRTILLVENKMWDFCFRNNQINHNYDEDSIELYAASSEGIFLFEF